MTHKVSTGEVTTGKGTWLFEEIALDAIFKRKIKGRNTFIFQRPYSVVWLEITAPGSYTFIGTTKDISEEQCREIVESYNDGGLFCRDYSLQTPVFGINALESLRSLLIAYQLNPELNYAILSSLNSKEK